MKRTKRVWFLRFEVFVDNVWLMGTIISIHSIHCILNSQCRVQPILKRDCSFVHFRSYVDGCYISWWHYITRINRSRSLRSLFRNCLHNHLTRCVLTGIIINRLQQRCLKRKQRVKSTKPNIQYLYSLIPISWLDCGTTLDSRAHCFVPRHWFNLFHLQVGYMWMNSKVAKKVPCLKYHRH